jgi:hypothetical protein
MNAAIANETISDLGLQARELTKLQMQQWFDWIDRILDIHRSNFVFREATPTELQEHKTGLKLAIRTCLWINALVADPDFNEPDLVSRLQIRIQQLDDAYNTFHDPAFSDQEADRILQHVFPQ